MKRLVNLHRSDQNIGDLVSAPSLYFDFPGYSVERADIIDFKNADEDEVDFIVGGGGLLCDFFGPSIKRLERNAFRRKLIAWGVGQQVDEGPYWRTFKSFRYSDYLNDFDLVGVRDDGFGYDWVPCPSCMSEVFDSPAAPVHEFVVFSHKSRPMPVMGWPCRRNDELDFAETIAFLASGETVLTSSFHGMYWATLLGRKVLAFPFNSKFFTGKYPVQIYPVRWKETGKLEALVKKLIHRHVGKYYCASLDGWLIAAAASRSFPGALEECRQVNTKFYHRVLNELD